MYGYFFFILNFINLKRPLIIIFSILIIDQILKIWIKTHMHLGEEFSLFGNWGFIHFIENNGMAFGLQIAGNFGKIILSVFRILAVTAIAWYLYNLTKKKAHKGLIFSIALIFAGAVGNIIDSAVYGLLFSASSYYEAASFMPEGGGYASFLHGKVVDMFYFPIIHGNYPEWIPSVGGKDFIFFRPVFNIADSSITIGVFILLLGQKLFFKSDKTEAQQEKQEI